jgi:hypothetical protein
MLPALLRPVAARGGASAIIKRPVLVPVSADGSARDRNCALLSTICLTMANRSKAAREAVDPGDDHHVAGREGVQHFEELAAVATSVSTRSA